jgi:cephalosporin hydroxylase
MSNDPIKAFITECQERAKTYRGSEMAQAAHQFMVASTTPKYSYNFSWLSRPIIQYPQDIVAMQEVIWQVKPDLIIECGIAHGGSLVLSASMLAMLDYCDAVEHSQTFDPRATRRRVLGLDIDIRPHNRAAIEAHPMAHRIDMMQGSSIAPEVITQVHAIAKDYGRVLVILDSNHTHAHVLAELEAYAPLTSPGSYCVVFDTMVEDLPNELFPDRPWGKGDNPKTAVWEYLRRLKEEGRTGSDNAPLTFEIDKAIENKLLITVAPDGYLKRIG